MRQLLALLLCLAATSASAQSREADNILGLYITEGNKGKVAISKKADKYYGKLVWIIQPDALDEHNPDKNKRKEKVLGKVILKDFVYTGNGTWEKGTVYDPESGKTYSGRILLEKNGDLNLRGFVGISLLGRTTIWKRVL